MEKATVGHHPQTELEHNWESLSDSERIQEFSQLPREEAEEFFFDLSARDQASMVMGLRPGERRSWVRLIEPDDVADMLQEIPQDRHESLLSLLDLSTKNEVIALLAYAEDVAGGLMNPRYARLRPDMTAAEAISYLQRQSREQAELIAYAYVLDSEQHLVGTVSFRDLCAGQPSQKVQELMLSNPVIVSEQMDQEEIGRIFAEHDLIAVPVVDSEHRMKGIVTVDDMIDVVDEEATEDIQKLGGTEALGAPYLRVGLIDMIRKRAVWLIVIFLSEMLTATAMSYYQNEVAKAIVLVVFLPLILSSGGNAGSQATTLVIRAMALDEIGLRDWWRVISREVIVGLGLGVILGIIGFSRIIAWQTLGISSYGQHFITIACTIGVSLIGVVMWGSIAGSILPFLLRAAGTDPAVASTPFVATLVDVTGLVIYFTTASFMLHGLLL